MTEFKVDKLGYYKNRKGDIFEVIYILKNDSEPRVRAIDINYPSDTWHFRTSGYFFTPDSVIELREKLFDIVEFIGEELPK